MSTTTHLSYLQSQIYLRTFNTRCICLILWWLNRSMIWLQVEFKKFTDIGSTWFKMKMILFCFTHLLTKWSYESLSLLMLLLFTPSNSILLKWDLYVTTLNTWSSHFLLLSSKCLSSLNIALPTKITIWIVLNFIMNLWVGAKIDF